MAEQNAASTQQSDGSRAGVVEVESQAFFPEEHRMQVGEKEIVIRPLVLGQFRKMVDALGRFIVALAVENPDIELDQIGSHIEQMLTVGSGHITSFISALTGIEEEYLDEHMTIRDVARFVRLTLEVNELPQIVEDFSLAAALAGKQLDLPKILESLNLALPGEAGPDSGAASSTS